MLCQTIKINWISLWVVPLGLPLGRRFQGSILITAIDSFVRISLLPKQFQIWFLGFGVLTVWNKSSLYPQVTMYSHVLPASENQLLQLIQLKANRVMENYVSAFFCIVISASMDHLQISFHQLDWLNRTCKSLTNYLADIFCFIQHLFPEGETL